MNERYDIISVGHVTHDLLRQRGTDTWFIGGAVYFSAFAAVRSGVRLFVVTKLAEKDFGLLDGLKEEGIEVLALRSRSTTSIENSFESDDVDKRKVNLLAQADPFALGDVPDLETRVYNLAGLFLGEIPPEMIEPLSRKASVALDLQAMLRTSQGGVFSWQDWPEKRRYLPFLTYLKADSLESAVITGTEDRREAARMLHDWGAREVLITHSNEVIVYDGTRVHSAPFNPSNLSGRTGRGDTCFISYMSRRLHHGIEDSVRYAAALTSIKMEKPGPFQGTVEEVLARMKQLEEDGDVET